ncbi:hypothetical protein ZIOFF_059673 [Zingiber officinale]|uniref:poly(A)-specific ribonuclease n=1 Tax=Zingiber officinale TaxID=94328 RepID=A0A8J5KMV8_ZINOF|nr:hypothetical protein ZIOFF_059673 [Zingiber officinale]
MAVAVVNNVNDMLISSSAAIASASRVEVRSVWAHNLDEEFALIRSAVPFHPFVALDTEYPGVVVASKNPYCTLTLPQRYELIRANVEALRIVQVGLTLSDAAGNLPCAIYSDGTCVRYVWEFNFRDFDISRDRFAPSSVELLKANGIDFQKNQIWGIDSCRFAHHLATSGLLSFGHFSPVSWVTFQGAYDFAFLVKMLTCDCKLPKTVREFLHLVHFFFGKRVFDVKHLCKHCPGLYGGLERVASTVRVERAVGSRQQSGSDSLLTWQSACLCLESCSGNFFVSRHVIVVEYEFPFASSGSSAGLFPKALCSMTLEDSRAADSSPISSFNPCPVPPVCLLCYLNDTRSYNLILRRHSSLALHVYYDADWTGDIDDHTSTGAYCVPSAEDKELCPSFAFHSGSVFIVICPSRIGKISKKKGYVARSSTETEYHVISSTVAKLQWVLSLLNELGGLNLLEFSKNPSEFATSAKWLLEFVRLK